jgi:NADPH:quinone reductase-like Zn-dependent oxidoreductase
MPGTLCCSTPQPGGVGLIACQWARAMGLQLIGTAGSDAKCALAKAHGAAFVINYRPEDFQARVKDITGGKGVKVVYDSVGKDTWDKSLDCLAPVWPDGQFWQRIRPGAAFAPGILGPKGSLYLTRQTLFTHIATRESTQAMADELFAVVLGGQVQVRIGQRYPLDAMCNRRTATLRHVKQPVAPSLLCETKGADARCASAREVKIRHADPPPLAVLPSCAPTPCAGTQPRRMIEPRT